MKCEKCNEKEATFYYSCEINGEKTERHLCPDCARAEGFGEVMDYKPMSAFAGAMESMFGDFFSPRRSLLSDFGFFGPSVRSIMAPSFPLVNLVVEAPKPERSLSENEKSIPDDAGEDVKQRREREALRAQLDAAVKAEDYEKAIELRDKLRELEK